MNTSKGAVAGIDITYVDKPLPRPASHIHPVRHGIKSIYYRRLETPLRKLQGYHFGVMCCAVTSMAVFFINLIITIWATSSYGLRGGLGTIQDGSCKRTTTLGFWLHLAINALSTLLLGASNYSMQCLSSPTRAEIDKAHSQNVWLDVGIQSVRNLRRLSSSRIAVWWLLALSSIPLHLFWNSAVFSSLSARQYNVFVVSSSILSGAPFDAINCEQSSGPSFIQTRLQGLVDNQSSLVRLDNRECIRAYVSPIVSSRADVLLVSSALMLTASFDSPQLSITDPLHECFVGVTPNFPNTGGSSSVYDWMCEPSATTNTCDLNQVVANASTALFEECDVQYCLSQEMGEHCKLQFSAAIMIIVIVCNLIKTICMACIVWRQDSEPLVTFGDAVASFLNKPDSSTKGNCLAGKHRYQGNEAFYPPQIRKASKEPNLSRTLDNIAMGRNWDPCNMKWDPKSFFWFQGASAQRWLVCNIL